MSNSIYDLADGRARFLALLPKRTKLSGSVRPGMSTPCLEWSGAQTKQGYGRFKMNGLDLYAHRSALEAYIGRPLADGLFALHACDNPPCCEATHLREGTNGQNMRDAVDRGRHHWASKTHCPAGHPYDQVNTYVQSDGGRACRTCRNDRVSAFKARRKTVGAQ